MPSPPSRPWRDSSRGPKASASPCRGRRLAPPDVAPGVTLQGEPPPLSLQGDAPRLPAPIQPGLAAGPRGQGHWPPSARCRPHRSPQGIGGIHLHLQPTAPGFFQPQGTSPKPLHPQRQIGSQPPQGAPHHSLGLDQPIERRAHEGIDSGEGIGGEGQLGLQVPATHPRPGRRARGRVALAVSCSPWRRRRANRPSLHSRSARQGPSRLCRGWPVVAASRREDQPPSTRRVPWRGPSRSQGGKALHPGKLREGEVPVPQPSLRFPAAGPGPPGGSRPVGRSGAPAEAPPGRSVPPDVPSGAPDPRPRPSGGRALAKSRSWSPSRVPLTQPPQLARRQSLFARESNLPLQLRGAFGSCNTGAEGLSCQPNPSPTTVP